MTNAEKVAAFAYLGRAMANDNDINLQHAIRQAAFHNPWFTPENVSFALAQWHKTLTSQNIEAWFAAEGIEPAAKPQKVGIVMAGNVPLVGLHDLLCVLACGHKAVLKLSADDSVLMQFAIDVLKRFHPTLAESIDCVKRLHDIDAVIATGSNNTARYFEYYFGKYPHIIRKNRNSVAVLNGKETQTDLFNLGGDIFRYFGLGCRNVTHLYLPVGYELPMFYDGIADWYEVLNNSRYANNYTYHKAILLMNLHQHLDNNFLLLKEDDLIYSPVGMLHYSFYDGLHNLEETLTTQADAIQVAVGDLSSINTLPFGSTQMPKLTDYADQVNTITFLKTIC
jgi:hypothetical protein